MDKFIPLELRSRKLVGVIYSIDTYIVDLEALVEQQEEEIKKLREAEYARTTELVADCVHDSEALAKEARDNIGRTLSLILDSANSVPPIDDKVGLDTVLILKHVQRAVLAIGTTLSDGGDPFEDLYNLRSYIAEALDKAATATNKHTNNKDL